MDILAKSVICYKCADTYWQSIRVNGMKMGRHKQRIISLQPTTPEIYTIRKTLKDKCMDPPKKEKRQDLLSKLGVWGVGGRVGREGGKGRKEGSGENA